MTNSFIPYVLNKQYSSMWDEVLEMWRNGNYQQPIYRPIPLVAREYTENLIEYLSKEYPHGQAYDHQEMCYPSRWSRTYQSIYGLSISLVGTGSYVSRITYMNGQEADINKWDGKPRGLYRMMAVDYGEGGFATHLPWITTDSVEGVVEGLHIQRENYINALNTLLECPECYYYSEAGNRHAGRALLGYYGRGLVPTGDCSGYKKYEVVVDA